MSIFKRFPYYSQLESMDCGPACLKMITKYYGQNISLHYLRKACNITKYGVTMEDIASAANELGFKTLPVHVDFEFLSEKQPLPLIAHWRNEHFVVVHKIKGDQVYAMDPSLGRTKYSKEKFIKNWCESSDSDELGYVLLFEPTKNLKPLKEEIKNPFLGFLEYFKGLKSYLLRLFLVVIFTSIIQLIFPLLTQHLVDQGIGQKDISFIYLILLGQLLLYTSEMFLGIVRSWITLYINNKISISYISDYLTKLLKLPISFYDSKNAGDILQRVGDFKKIHAFFSSTLVQIVLSILNFFLFGFLLFTYSTTIFLVFIGGSAVYVAWTVLFLKKRSMLDYERFSYEAVNQDMLIQLVNGIEEIKLNVSERKRRWEWEGNQVTLLEISEKSLRLSQLQNNGGIFINEIKNLAIILIASQQVIELGLSLGAFVSIQYIIGQLNVPVKEIVSFTQTAQDAKNSFDRLSEINTWEEEDDAEKDAGFPEDKSIIIKDVCFSYGVSLTKTEVLHNLNFIIESGKTTAIVGDSGSGKTTLLKLLTKLYSPDQGEILIGSKPLGDLSSKEWRKKCGVVMQGGYIFNDTILRNVTESSDGEGLDTASLELALEVANLNEVLSSLPLGVQTPIGANGINLSGGQKQRVLIARALYKNPEYVFLDEATSSLDSINEKSIVKKLSEFYKKKTVVVIAHRLSTVMNADSIVVLKSGQIIEQGTHLELLEAKGHYYELVKNQMLQ